MAQWLAAAVAIVVISSTVLPLLRHDAWWIRSFDFPRLQIAIVTAAALAAYLWVIGLGGVLDGVLATAMFLCLAYQGALISSYTPLRSVEAKEAEDPDPSHCVSLIVANVLTPNRNADALLQIIAARKADLLLFVETDAWWESQLDVLGEEYPYAVKCPKDNLYGMHLYSRLELVEPGVRFLVEEDVPSIHAKVKLPSGSRVAIHCVHPRPPAPGENPRSTERDAELLLVARAVAAENGPAIVFGDLNDVAWSATTTLFRKLSGMLDPRIGRGLFSTFHAKYPFLRWPLDHVFFSPDFRLVALERLGYFGSDHFPIYAAICHCPGEETAQAPTADAEDRARAQEKIDEVDAGGAVSRCSRG